MHYGYMNGWGAGVMVLSMLLFWIPLFAGGYLLYRLVRDRGTHDNRLPSPEQILGERYARGEIDHEEYARRLETLRRH